MSKERNLKYIFKFKDKTQLDFDIVLDKDLNYINQDDSPLKDWVKLENKKCSNCTLNSSEHPSCPVAKNLDFVVEKTKDKISYEKAIVSVTTPERTYIKQTDTQEGLLSLFGLIMATSGCPHLGWFKPLVKYHLPFSSVDETMFRILSMHLVTEYLSSGEGKNFNITEMKKHYTEVETVNLDFINRIRSQCKGDADLNAVAALDLFAKLFDFEFASNFDSLRSNFLK
jgi:hypothetical protein